MKTPALCHRVCFIIIYTFVSIWAMARPTNWQSRGIGGGGAGSHALTFNAGTPGKGIYYYKLQAGKLSSTSKMVIQ